MNNKQRNKVHFLLGLFYQFEYFKHSLKLKLKRTMKSYRRVILMLILPLLVGQLSAENNYPIVLIHGFVGWGPEEMGGYHYWGGKEDLAAYLELQGHEVYEVSVGPVSSNWERAVEAYTQIKGGQVDYGKSHAEKWGIVQMPKGKVYEGLYPQWDENHPVHLIGHSMGGQTIRMLSYLLTEIFYTEEDTVPEAGNLLGQPRQGWIKSISTFATPHNGTTLSDIITKSIPFLQNFIGLAAVVGTNFYDFDLEHWNFDRQEEETWMEYFRRVREHPAWNTQNICAWDLSIDGARELNGYLQANPEIYYFSFALSSTHVDSATGYHLPNDDTSLILKAKARQMGKKTVYWDDGTVTDSTWFESDGVVNTISQFGPTTGLTGPDPIAEYHEDEPLIPGQWYVFGPLSADHWKIIGHGVTDEEREEIFTIYREHCDRLNHLP